MSRIYTTTADYRNHELEPALGTYSGEFNVDAIMAELIETGYVYYDEDEKGFRDDQDTDTGDGERFWNIVSKHELGAQGMVDAINAAEPYGHPYEETGGIWQARWDRARDFEDHARTEFYCEKVGDDSAGVVTSSGIILVPDAHDRAGDWGYDATGNHPEDAWTNWLADNAEWCDTCGEAHTYKDLYDETTPCS